MPAPTTPSTPFDKNTAGRDFNFYKKVSVEDSAFKEECDAIITFSTQTVMMLLENSSGVAEYSFNGNTVHGELNSSLPSRAISFDNRKISKIWFILRSGSPGPLTVRIDAWGIP